ncbi:MAG: zinc-ribbon domain-containing protein [Clostridiaceae bacterium]|jgi:hypothetical protein|nr:zinc-ribbon domain-containing protein [Oscillospiraceae bacterium]NLO61897.1 zinc-ribbon domain-containing protein [Clostridiaceae bacterium]
MIIWGWNKKTRKVIGTIGMQMCKFCNIQSLWQLCIVRTWFTLFFIPIIPYGKSYQISCPGCNSYYELTKEQFSDLKARLAAGETAPNAPPASDVADSEKYQGKTETQINYLKAMEEAQRED